MILRFCSGSTIAGQPVQKERRGVDEDQRQLQPLVARADLRRLVQPQDAVVHEDARQLVADRAVNDERGHRRIDAAAERADHAPARRPARGSSPSPLRQTTPSSSRPCSRRRRTRSCAGSRGRVRCARPRDETGARTAALRVRHRGNRGIGAGRDDREPCRRRGHEIAVAGPDADLRRARRRTVRRSARPRQCDRFRAGSKRTRPAADGRRVLDNRHGGMPELALRRRRDASAERMRHQLHAVADAEHRTAHVEQRGIASGGALRRTRFSVPPTG